MLILTISACDSLSFLATSGQATTRVYGGVDKLTGNPCAVKVVAKKTLAKAKIAEVRRECRVMRELQALPHSNLVQMKDAFEDRRNIYIIMELCVGRLAC